MSLSEPPRHLRLAKLPTSEPTDIRLVPEAGEIQQLIRDLDLLGLRKVRLEGTLRPQGRSDWTLDATLGATAIQPCSVTLAPVTTRIDVPLRRQYVADYSLPEEAEAEIPEDDSLEPLPEVLDLMAVLGEALALALPDFPRAEGAELTGTTFAEDGVEPLTDEDVKPFAGLAELKKQLES
ncbi:uncharacterized metal-binding protein YceD (DUF177 family) [Aliiruegeria haliotis]|uniref:Uncharacterized metal-binding protein YceD (DUF177 family) n=1 Tax=Aliiruegeria haliotis TaxID=1280846 RepID=A0A2T0RZM2_9RHOB|nr:DUF177 domain-containing protein [Aliiruegeria haliotis]PRY26627.1 uncharacterized metal-binding protein YceD (DUF177 family) [Aliiruegeria haliotis]